MKITNVRLFAVNATRAYATQIAQEGGGTQSLKPTSQFFFLQGVTDRGTIGWGEISDVPLPEAAADDDIPDTRSLLSSLREVLVGLDPFDVAHLHHQVNERWPLSERAEFPRLVSAAADMLCYDLQSQAAGVPVYKLFGGKRRQNVTISWVAFIRDDLELLREEIAEKVAEGFTAFKLKVGGNIDLDEARLAVLRDAAGATASLKIDPNGAWGPDDARRNLARLARFNLAGVETPIAYRDADELAALRREVDIPLIEHVMTREQAMDYARHESVDCFNIATTGCGGLKPATDIAMIADACGAGVLLGSTVELTPGTLAQLQLAAAVNALSLPSDLVGPALYERDVVGQPVRYERGTLSIPDTIGFGTGLDVNGMEHIEA